MEAPARRGAVARMFAPDGPAVRRFREPAEAAVARMFAPDGPAVRRFRERAEAAVARMFAPDDPAVRRLREPAEAAVARMFAPDDPAVRRFREPAEAGDSGIGPAAAQPFAYRPSCGLTRSPSGALQILGRRGMAFDGRRKMVATGW